MCCEFGHKAVEEFKVGDRLWARSEFDPAGPLELKAIEEVFVRRGLVLELSVGGQVIGTTAEHPFYAYGKGWTPAGELAADDLLATGDGRWLPVEKVYNTGALETVYNFRIADHHTYFVGGEEWGFSVWVHNARYAPSRVAHPNLYPDEAYTAVQRFELRQINGKWKTVDARGHAFTARGNYNYVVEGDKVFVTKVASQPAMGQRVAGHIDIARGRDVAYAGEIRFGASTSNRGKLQWWDNASGHYRPKAADAASVSDLLPLDLFRGR